MNQPKKDTTYTCEGSCQAQITQKQYDEGLVSCGAKSCNHFAKPFKKVKTKE